MAKSFESSRARYCCTRYEPDELLGCATPLHNYIGCTRLRQICWVSRIAGFSRPRNAAHLFVWKDEATSSNATVRMLKACVQIDLIMPWMAPLAEYRRKRRFAETPEPRGKSAHKGEKVFVIQKHAARRLHYDLRLEVG